jgi:hypothetical protein
MALVLAAAAPDIIVYGDPTPNHALHGVADRFTAQTGVPVHVLAAPPSRILGQLRPGVWNDVVRHVALGAASDRLSLSGLIDNKQPWTPERLRTLPQSAGSHAMSASRAGA